MHSAHFHGHTLSENGRNMDSFKLIPSVVRTTTLVPDNPGIWLYHCHVRSPIPLCCFLRPCCWLHGQIRSVLLLYRSPPNVLVVGLACMHLIYVTKCCLLLPESTVELVLGVGGFF